MSTDQLEQLRDVVRNTSAMRDVCARDIADRCMAGDTTSETFASAMRVYQNLTAELSDSQIRLGAALAEPRC